MMKNKITFIYAYESEDWSTPMALANEFKSRNWDVEFVSIGSNKTGIYRDNLLQMWVQRNEPSDIVLFMDFGRFNSHWLDKKYQVGFWVQESGDDPQNFEKNFPKSNKFHMTLSPDKESAEEYVKRGVNAHWWTHFADTKVQFPIKVSSKFEYVAVTTRGKGGSEFLDTIVEHSDGMVGNKNNLNHLEHTEFLNKGMMVLQNSRWGEVTRRIFEGMACGKMVLTDKLNESKGLDELFEDKKHIVYYDDMADCINKMNYYREHYTERETIALEGYNKVLKYHTQKQRVDFILEQWKNYTNTK